MEKVDSEEPPRATALEGIGAALGSFTTQAGEWLSRFHHSMTPVGRAEDALERGDSRFLIELQVDHETMRIVDAIEAVGWHYERADYQRVDERTVGVYQFRRAEGPGGGSPL